MLELNQIHSICVVHQTTVCCAMPYFPTLCHTMPRHHMQMIIIHSYLSAQQNKNVSHCGVTTGNTPTYNKTNTFDKLSSQCCSKAAQASFFFAVSLDTQLPKVLHPNNPSMNLISTTLPFDACS